MGWHEPAGSGDWIPASAGMTGGGAVSGTGNHKGCPYDGWPGFIFVGMTGELVVPRPIHGVFKTTLVLHITLTPTPVSSTGQALSRDGKERDLNRRSSAQSLSVCQVPSIPSTHQ